MAKPLSPETTTVLATSRGGQMFGGGDLAGGIRERMDMMRIGRWHWSRKTRNLSQIAMEASFVGRPGRGVTGGNAVRKRGRHGAVLRDNCTPVGKEGGLQPNAI